MRKYLKNKIEENHITANKLTFHVLMQNCLPQKCPLGDNSEVGNSELAILQNFPPQLLFVVFFMCWYDVHWTLSPR